MSGSWSPAADAWITMSAGAAGAVGTGAFTMAVLVQPAVGNNNCGMVQGRTASAAVRSLLEDTLHLFGENDFSSGDAVTLTQGTWYVAAQSKASGSATYRHHLWAYASDGSGTMTHAVSTGSSAMGDGSAITEIRIGHAGNRGNGLIAVVALWDSELSDAQLNTLKSGSLAAWAALSPDALFSLENWDGVNDVDVIAGTSTFSSLTGTVSVGANPPSFDFALTAAADPGVVNLRGPAPGRLTPNGVWKPWQGTGQDTAGTAHTVDHTDDTGLTDTVTADRSNTVTDDTGLTDPQALGVTNTVTDDAGLTDTATVQSARFVTTTDDSGLTDTTALTRSPVATDSTGLTDSAAQTQTHAYTDSTGLTDTVTAQAAKLVVVDDTAGLTDTTTYSRTIAATDTAGLTDTLAQQRTQTVTDPAGLTDTVTTQRQNTQTITDSTGLTDTLTTNRTLTITDTAGLTDTVTTEGGTTAQPPHVGVDTGGRASTHDGRTRSGNSDHGTTTRGID